MKKILTISVVSVMAFGTLAHADENVAQERFHQKDTNFGGTAKTARSNQQPVTLPHKYVMYRRLPSSQHVATNTNTNVSTGHSSGTNPYPENTK